LSRGYTGRLKASGRFFSVAAAALLTVSPAFAQNVLIANANVIDGLSPTIQANVSILIADGKIARIAQFKIDLPAGVTVIDVKGRYVLPGLIDAHSHLASLDAAKRALESGAMIGLNRMPKIRDDYR
jgi:imidazolonepropionase-like amidohydrolase